MRKPTPIREATIQYIKEWDFLNSSFLFQKLDVPLKIISSFTSISGYTFGL